MRLDRDSSEVLAPEGRGVRQLFDDHREPPQDHLIPKSMVPQRSYSVRSAPYGIVLPEIFRFGRDFLAHLAHFKNELQYRLRRTAVIIGKKWQRVSLSQKNGQAILYPSLNSLKVLCFAHDLYCQIFGSFLLLFRIRKNFIEKLLPGFFVFFHGADLLS